MIKRFLTALGLAFLFLTGCTVSTAVLNRFAVTRLTKQPVEAFSNQFPILVIAERDNGQLDAALVRHFDLELVDQQFPSRTFLIPEGKEAEVNRRLGTLRITPRKGEEPPVARRGSVRVESQATGRQQLVVQDTADTDWEITGWYEATADSLIPRYETNYARDRAFAATYLVTVPVNIAVWALGWVFWRWRQRRLLGPGSP